MATSASLRTANYELRKYASMDEVKVLQDFNVNMDLIDTAVHTVAETLDVTAGVVSDSVARLDGIDDSVDALQTAVNTANTTANSALSASGIANAGVAAINAFNTKTTTTIDLPPNFTGSINVLTKRSGTIKFSNYITVPSTGVANGGTIGTLLEGYRPPELLYINGSYGPGEYKVLPIRIDTNGVISARNPVPSNGTIIYSGGFDL